MNEPQWITVDTIGAIHSLQLAEHGGQDGTRDFGLLESALNRPRNQWRYFKVDLASIAAAYAFGIAKNHPFFDGNKRTAGVVCETFLVINDKGIEASSDEWYKAILTLAAGELSEEDFATWLRDHLQDRSE